MSRFKRPMTYKELVFQQYGQSLESYMKKQNVTYKEIQSIYKVGKKKKPPCK